MTDLTSPHGFTNGCPSTLGACRCVLQPHDTGDHTCDPTCCGGRWSPDGEPVLYPGQRADGSFGLSLREAVERAVALGMPREVAERALEGEERR